MDIISMEYMYEYYKYETYIYGNPSLSMFGLGKPQLIIKVFCWFKFNFEG